VARSEAMAAGLLAEESSRMRESVLPPREMSASGR